MRTNLASLRAICAPGHVKGAGKERTVVLADTLSKQPRFGTQQTFDDERLLERIAEARIEIDQARLLVLKAADTMDKLTWFVSLVRPALGTLQIRDIATPDVVRAVEPIAKSGRVDTAHRVRAVLSRIFAFAAVRGMCNGDPAAPLKKERSVLPARSKVQRQ